MCKDNISNNLPIKMYTVTNYSMFKVEVNLFF